jgi:hypothetical protein
LLTAVPTGRNPAPPTFPCRSGDAPFEEARSEGVEDEKAMLLPLSALLCWCSYPLRRQRAAPTPATVTATATAAAVQVTVAAGSEAIAPTRTHATATMATATLATATHSRAMCATRCAAVGDVRRTRKIAMARFSLIAVFFIGDFGIFYGLDRASASWFVTVLGACAWAALFI